jgi:hypothetical protein
MAAPPKPKKATPDDLAEVERALSVLQGRHPEHERARREADESRKLRAVELDTVARMESERVRSRRVAIVAVAVAIVPLFTFIGVFGSREMARRARIDAVSEQYRVHGFTAIETSLRGSTGALEATAEPGCLLAVSTDTKPVSITRAGVTLSSAPPTLFCTCTSEQIAVTSPVGGLGGIALLRADAALIGGSRAFAVAPFKPASTLVADEPCSEASLDAWIEAKQFPHPPVDDAWLAAAPARAPLKASGFHVLAFGPPEAPFVVVDVPKESCLLATSASVDDRLGLRMKGEPALVAEASGAVGRCAQAGGKVLVSRDGKGEVAVLVAPAAMVGGLLGLREVAASAGLVLVSSAVPGSERAWDAKQLLLASAIPEAIIKTSSASDVPKDSEARIVALSLETPSALTFETAPEVKSSCAPLLGVKTREAVCVFTGVQKWRTPGGADGVVGGLARSKLPFWLYTMQGVKDPAALDGITKLLAIARFLGREGFTPTTLEALVEQPNGVDVLGRTGEDAVVAVGVAPSEPWIYPLTEDAEWTLDDPPKMATVKPLEKITLVTALKKLPPINSRRTVVFRRQKRAE